MLNVNESSWVVAGLGNPGKRYALTRHNIGWLTVIALAEKLGISFKEETRFEAQIAKGQSREAQVHLILPMTYMNLSGQAINKYTAFYKLPVSRLIVVSDEIALPFGEMRLRISGSAGGHNGLKSIEWQMGTSQYIRLRMGIGAQLKNKESTIETAEEVKQSLADYVLSPFTKDEMNHLQAFVMRGVEVLERCFHEPASHVMTEVNKRIMKPKPPETGEEKKDESRQTKPI